MLAVRCMEPTITIRLVIRILEAAVEEGLDREALEQELGGSRSALTDPEARLPIAIADALLGRAIRELDDRAFPLRVAQRTSVEDLHVIGFALITARTMREALQRMARYFAFVSDGGRWSVVESKETAELCFERSHDGSLGGRAGVEVALASCVNGIRQVASELVPLSVHIAHSASCSADRHETFFCSPVHFGRGRNAIIVPRSLLDIVPSTANPAMGTFFEEYLENAMASAPVQSDLVARTREAILRALPSGGASLEDVAQHLGISARTLRRRLSAEAHSFRRLLDDARRVRAEDLLVNPELPLTEIAFALGFADQSAFTRAFRKWTGKAPGTARRQLVAVRGGRAGD